MTLSLLGVLAITSLAGSDVSGSGTLILESKTQRNASIELPRESYQLVSGSLPLPGAGDYATELDGKNLRVDTDGDGATDVRIEGEDGIVVLRGTNAAGEERTQAWRLRSGPRGWEYASAGTRAGKLGKTKIQLIDQDGDGRYDGYGRDAMIVGRGKVACFLSRAVNVGGTLYAIEVAADGSSLDYELYAGETGELDLSSELQTDAKLLSAIVRSTDGRFSFDLAKVRAALKVPVGEYALHSGRIGLGESSVSFFTGRSEPIQVAGDAELRIEWGGPVEAEFSYDRRGAKLSINPADVHYFGTLGEEYGTWTPRGSSPEFTVKERKLGTELTKAIFPGSC